MGRFMHHLVPGVTRWWPDPGEPAMPPALQRAVVEGVAEATGGAPIPGLAARRDAALARPPAARKG
jgi:DsbC/DsbD-like thiol-disulfide interchange protein